MNSFQVTDHFSEDCYNYYDMESRNIDNSEYAFIMHLIDIIRGYEFRFCARIRGRLIELQLKSHSSSESDDYGASIFESLHHI
jgi:hypothetical protein